MSEKLYNPLFQQACENGTAKLIRKADGSEVLIFNPTSESQALLNSMSLEKKGKEYPEDVETRLFGTKGRIV